MRATTPHLSRSARILEIPLVALDRREAEVEKQLVNKNLPWTTPLLENLLDLTVTLF